MPRGRQNKQWLNIDAGETVEITFLSDVRPVMNESKGYMQYFYDVEHSGEEYAFGASPGLQNLLEEDGVGEGAVVTIKRTGTGLDTRWRVNTTKAGKSAGRVPEASRGSSRGPAPARDMSVEDFKQVFQAMLALVREVNEGTKDVMTNDGLYTAAAALVAPALAHSVSLPTGKSQTPASFITDTFKRAGIKAVEWETLAEHLFGHDLEEVNRDDATTLWTLTQGGKDLEPLVEQYRRMMEEAAGEDIDEDALPF